MMTEDQIQDFVDKQYSHPRLFHGENQIIDQIDYLDKMEALKTRKMTRKKKRKKKRSGNSKNKFKN